MTPRNEYQPQRRMVVPVESKAPAITISGREIRWLSRLVGAIGGPFLNWLARRRRRRQRRR